MKTQSLILVLVALLLVAGVLVLFPGLIALTQSSPAGDMPSGSILISSVTSTNLPFLDSYALNVSTSQLAMVEMSSTSQENMYEFSSDGAAITFLGTTQTLVQSMISQHKQGDPMQVYVAAAATGTLPTVSQAEALTNDVADQKEVPVISDDGRSVLYMEIPADLIATSSPSIAGYAIHLLSDASSTLSVPGMYPQWYGLRHFYYLWSDGVRLYDIRSATSTLLIPIAAQSNFKIAVSHGGSMLAFSDPDSSTVFVYSISANGYQLTLLKSLNVNGYWMVFSPDDAYLAVQTADATGAPELLIFDTKDFAQVGGPISLSPLLNTRLFVTGWVR
jgi:Tol biopolymer transport system component